MPVTIRDLVNGYIVQDTKVHHEMCYGTCSCGADMAGYLRDSVNPLLIKHYEKPLTEQEISDIEKEY